MKILQINKFYYPWVGGVEKIVQQIAEGLNEENNLKIDVLACNSKNERVIEEVNKVKVFRAKTLRVVLGMPLSFDFLSLYKKIAGDYDLIFLHYPFPLSFLAYFLFSRGKDLVIWYHSDIVRQRLLEVFFKPLHLFCLKKAKKIFVSNPNLIRSSNYLSKFEYKCVVIPFGVDLNYFQENEDIKKKSAKIKKIFKKPLILSVGRLVSYKGFKYLIKAALEVEAQFLIIGEGKLKRSLLKLIKKLNLSDKFFILPFVDDLRPYYLACDIFVLPSISKAEAFGIVLLEAIVCGKPVISTRLNTGVDWLNMDQSTGFVVEPKNEKELASRINFLLKNKDFYQQFSENSKKRAKEFSLEKFLISLKNELLSSS